MQLSHSVANLALIIGLAVGLGGGCFMLAIALLIYFVIRKRRQKVLSEVTLVKRIAPLP